MLEMTKCSHPRSRGIARTALLSNLRFSSVLRTSVGFREVGVGGLQQWILVPVSELALHGGIAGWIVFILFHSAFRAVLILRNCHN